jgi:hypothetical protein
MAASAPQQNESNNNEESCTNYNACYKGDLPRNVDANPAEHAGSVRVPRVGEGVRVALGHEANGAGTSNDAVNDDDPGTGLIGRHSVRHDVANPVCGLALGNNKITAVQCGDHGATVHLEVDAGSTPSLGS